MSLVAYDFSDEDETDGKEDDDGETEKTPTNVQILDTKPTLNGDTEEVIPDFDIEDDDITNVDAVDDDLVPKSDTHSMSDSSSLFTALPTPKHHDVNLNSIRAEQRMKSDPVKILLPSLTEFDNDEDFSSRKRIKPSEKGSGLFALLPPPKYETKLKPTQISNTPAPKKPTIKNAPPTTKPIPIVVPSIEDEDTETGSDFFSLSVKDEPVHVPDIEELYRPNEEPMYPQIGPSVPEPEVSYPVMQECVQERVQERVQDEAKLESEAIDKLCGRKGRNQIPDDLEIIDVNEDLLLADCRQSLMKHMTEEVSHKPSRKKNCGPSSMQKRKHQITYLAYQAKENEIELKNQWANNRYTKKQTQSKYGF